MKKILLTLAGVALVLTACNSGGSSNPSNTTLYLVDGALLKNNNINLGCTVSSDDANAINCSVGAGNGYSATFTYTFTSSTPGSYLDLATAQENAANNNLSNVTLTQTSGGSCTQTATTGSYSCDFSIQGASGANTVSFQIPLNGSLGAQSYITVNVQ